jgi:hypothetical protein
MYLDVNCGGAWLFVVAIFVPAKTRTLRDPFVFCVYHRREEENLDLGSTARDL